MSAHTEPIIDDGDTVTSHREILKKNDTVVVFESPEQATQAMLTNYRANSRVWFDNYQVQWPWDGSFHQTFTNLPSDEQERRRFINRVADTFHALFPVQFNYVQCYNTYVVVLADGGHPTRTPNDWSSMKLN
jgi:hypothetical protein